MQRLILLMLWLPATALLSAAEPAADLQARVAAAFEKPLCAGHDVAVALTHWFAATKATDPAARKAAFEKALAALQETQPLPAAVWPKDVAATDYKVVESTVLPGAPHVRMEVAAFKVDDLRQYALIMRPVDNQPRPLLQWLHGAAFGVPTYSLPTFVRLVEAGYAVAAPALRGEPLFAGLPEGTKNRYVCEGKIENLLGEPRDVAALGLRLLEQPWVSGDNYGIIGHSFGSGAGLLAAARRPEVKCIVSYDAWLTNAFRFYWERLRGGSKYYWESWEQYTEAPVKDQLSGLMARSIVQNADRLQAPTLLFVGELDGAAYHTSHDELAAALKRAGKTFRYETIPGGGHNFVLYQDTPPAQAAWKIQSAWLQKHFPAGKAPQRLAPKPAKAVTKPTAD